MLLAFLNGCLNLEFGDEAKVLPYLKMRPGDRLDREAKVSAMKEKMGAEKALKVLAEQLAATQATKAGSHTIDEDNERAHLLATLRLWMLKACSTIEMNQNELGMLEMMASRRAAGGGGEDQRMLGGGADARSRKPPVVLTKEKVQEMVRSGQGINRADFKLVTRGYGPIGAPTMSLDELAQIEMAQAAKGGEQSTVKVYDSDAPDSDGDEAANAATYKAREWDVFKDTTRNGDGNRHNMG